MTKKTRTAHQQRARQEQWQRRVQAQIGGETTRPNGTPAAMSNTAIEDDLVEGSADGNTGYQQAEMRQMSGGVSTSGAATKSMNRAGAATMPTAGQRRAIAASRASRAKIAMNTMSLEEEMHYVRADIRKLVILTAACLAIIITLAIVINFL